MHTSAPTIPMWKIQGRLQLSALRELSGEAVSANSIDRPGIDLKWNPAHVGHAWQDGIAAFVLGKPRTAGGALDAQALIERYRRAENISLGDIGGSFALIVLDTRKATLHLWLDRFAGETLCFSRQSGEFAISDRACDVPCARRTIESQSLYNYLYFHVIPAPGTVFREVVRLDAGEYLQAGVDSHSLKRWWKPRFVENDYADLAGRQRQFVELVRESVAEEADQAATACFLSGGTDSSTVAGMLTRIRNQPADCYSIGFEAEGYDEMQYARIAVKHFGLRHHEYYVTPQDLLDAIPKVGAAYDQPFGNSSVLPTYYCALKARADGHTRMLAGDGGDELFGGNSRYASQQLFELYRCLPAGLRSGMLEPMAKGWKIFRTVPGLRQMGGYVRHSSVPMPDRMETFNLLHAIGEDNLLAPAFRALIKPGDALDHQRHTYAQTPTGSLLNKMLVYDWKYTLADSDLPKVRGATHLADMGVGFPLLSRQLTDFSLTLPPNWKLRHMKLRWFFKRALSEFLPVEIIKKSKHGFGLPFGPWVLRNPKLNILAERALDGITARGILKEGMAPRLMKEYLPRAPGYYGEIVWILMMLETWLGAHAPEFTVR